VPADVSELVRDGFRTFNEGGAPAFIDYLTRMDAIGPGFEMKVQEDAPNGGTWRGLDGFNEMVRTWLEAWEEFEVFPEKPIEFATDRYIVPARQRVVARGSGMELEERFFYTFEFAEGRVERIGLFIERPLAEAHLSSA
jgi:hypothetical protein